MYNQLEGSENSIKALANIIRLSWELFVFFGGLGSQGVNVYLTLIKSQ